MSFTFDNNSPTAPSNYPVCVSVSDSLAWFLTHQAASCPLIGHPGLNTALSLADLWDKVSGLLDSVPTYKSVFMTNNSLFGSHKKRLKRLFLYNCVIMIRANSAAIRPELQIYLRHLK